MNVIVSAIVRKDPKEEMKLARKLFKADIERKLRMSV